MKRVLPASCGRPDNSWAAAKKVARSNFTGRVTSLGCFSPPVTPILKLMYGHSYCGNHVSKEGGLTSQNSKSDAKSGEELLVYEVFRKKLLTEFLGL